MVDITIYQWDGRQFFNLFRKVFNFTYLKDRLSIVLRYDLMLCFCILTQSRVSCNYKDYLRVDVLIIKQRLFIAIS